MKVLLFWILLLDICSFQAWSDQPTPSPGPHGGKVLKTSKGLAELKMDFHNGKIHIYIPKHPEKNPQGIEAVIYDKDNQTFRIQLNKLDQLPKENDEMIHYQGQLDPSQSSYMGIKISLPLSKEKSTVFEDRTLFKNPD